MWEKGWPWANNSLREKLVLFDQKTWPNVCMSPTRVYWWMRQDNSYTGKQHCSSLYTQQSALAFEQSWHWRFILQNKSLLNNVFNWFISYDLKWPSNKAHPVHLSPLKKHPYDFITMLLDQAFSIKRLTFTRLLGKTITIYRESIVCQWMALITHFNNALILTNYTSLLERQSNGGETLKPIRPQF